MELTPTTEALFASKQDVAKKRQSPTLLFDLDGTLIDSIYQHILSWAEALEQLGISLPNWFIHRHIGMSDSLLLKTFSREVGRQLGDAEKQKLKELNTQAYMRRVHEVRPLPGAKNLLETLTRLDVPWAVATSGTREKAQESFKLLGIDTDAPIITADEVDHGKPHPDLFLAAAEKLETPIDQCIAIGDSIWDLLAAQRARALGVGVLCGGFGKVELMDAGRIASIAIQQTYLRNSMRSESTRSESACNHSAGFQIDGGND